MDYGGVLAITKAIVESHSGRVEAQSKGIGEGLYSTSSASIETNLNEFSWFGEIELSVLAAGGGNLCA